MHNKSVQASPNNSWIYLAAKKALDTDISWIGKVPSQNYRSSSINTCWIFCLPKKLRVQVEVWLGYPELPSYCLEIAKYPVRAHIQW